MPDPLLLDIPHSLLTPRLHLRTFRAGDGAADDGLPFSRYYRDSDDPWEQSANAQMGRYYQLSRARLLTLAATSPNLGRILEVGCGHGLVSSYLALACPDRHVVGVDIDEHKIEVAHRAAAHLDPRASNLEFATSGDGTLPRGPWDAIIGTWPPSCPP